MGRQMGYFKTGLYFGYGTQYGGPFGAGTDTLLRYELSLQGIWVPLGSDSIFSPYVGVRAGGMGVKSERLTGGSFKPGVVLAPMAGLGLQLGLFPLTAGMGSDPNLGPHLGPTPTIPASSSLP